MKINITGFEGLLEEENNVAFLNRPTALLFILYVFVGIFPFPDNLYLI